VELAWKASKDPQVVGYILRYGPHANSYLNPTFVKGTTAVVRGLEPGKWYFTVSAHEDAFVECWTLSNEAVVELKR